MGVGVSGWVMGTTSRGPQKEASECTAGRRMKEKEKKREGRREGNLRVQNAKCWCVCFPSLLFRAMTERENKRQHWYITRTTEFQLCSQSSNSTANASHLSPNLGYLFISNLHTWKLGTRINSTVLEQHSEPVAAGVSPQQTAHHLLNMNRKVVLLH